MKANFNLYYIIYERTNQFFQVSLLTNLGYLTLEVRISLNKDYVGIYTFSSW